MSNTYSRNSEEISEAPAPHLYPLVRSLAQEMLRLGTELERVQREPRVELTAKSYSEMWKEVVDLSEKDKRRLFELYKQNAHMMHQMRELVSTYNFQVECLRSIFQFLGECREQLPVEVQQWLDGSAKHLTEVHKMRMNELGWIEVLPKDSEDSSGDVDEDAANDDSLKLTPEDQVVPSDPQFAGSETEVQP